MKLTRLLKWRKFESAEHLKTRHYSAEQMMHKLRQDEAQVVQSRIMAGVLMPYRGAR